jgi:hypothetical protein
VFEWLVCHQNSHHRGTCTLPKDKLWFLRGFPVWLIRPNDDEHEVEEASQAAPEGDVYKRSGPAMGVNVVRDPEARWHFWSAIPMEP